MAKTKSQRNILRRPEVSLRTGLSGSHLWRLEGRGDFPARVKLGPMAVGWYEDEIDAWVESRPRAGGTQPPLPKSRRKPPPQVPHSKGAGIGRAEGASRHAVARLGIGVETSPAAPAQ
jgi:prophage regulatory protein